MTTVHPTRTLYNTIITRIATQTSQPCGDAVRPPAASPPYSVLYPLPDRSTDGGLGDPNEVEVMLFQVTCVGDTMDEAQELQFDVRTALLGYAPVAAEVMLDLGSGVSRDDDGPTFFTTDRFSVFVS